jgi:large subunit ribosomal protein L4
MADTQAAVLPVELFDAPTNIPLIHQVVTAQLAAARQGTHKTKNRGEVSGSGRKPFKQKGTGRSRQGSIRAPEHTGGGVVHGPTPRNYAQRTPKKMIAAALLGALSDRARAGRVHVLEALVEGDVPSTKQAAAALADVRGGKRQLLVVGREETVALKSVRNLQNVELLHVDQLNAYDVLVADDVVFTRTALDAFVAAKSATDRKSAAAGTNQTDVPAAAESGTETEEADA